jgi:hypothetical protein
MSQARNQREAGSKQSNWLAEVSVCTVTRHYIPEDTNVDLPCLDQGFGRVLMQTKQRTSKFHNSQELS